MQLLAWLKEYLQFVVAIVSAAVALVPVWSRSETSRIDRWFVALIAAILSIFLWPSDLAEYCAQRPYFAAAGIALVVLAVIAYLGQMWLRQRFGQSQITLDENDKKTRTILGGPVLTSIALKLHQANPDWTTQKLFEKLGCDPLRMWERMPRSRIVLTDALLEITRGTATILAITATCAYLFSGHEVTRLSRPLTVVPSAVGPLGPGGSVLFTADVFGCDREVVWRLDGPSKPDGALGNVDLRSGIYTAPSRVDHPFDVYVTALWRSKDETKRVTVRLVPPPDYTTPHVAEGADDKNQTARFVVQVIDQRYSWSYNDVTLAGKEEGAAFARRMAADGLFNGYEDIICIGAASRQYLTKANEENRATERARTLAGWIRDTLPDRRVRVRALKIGRYDDERRLPPEATSNERQVVIVGVSHPGKSVDLVPALRNAFAKLRDEAPILGMYLDHYPVQQWDLTPRN